jgi:tRNA threonylcarbamoyladenosine biosynthesis protein TsaB
MLILAVDTSGRRGSVALCRGDADMFEVLAETELEGGTYSARLVPCIAELLNQGGFEKSNIDGIAVVDGPGSFTGLRVGVSTTKALCEVLGRPMAAVSMLEALALTYGPEGQQVTAVLDAGRGELYVGDYGISGECAELKGEYIAKQVDFLAELPSRESPVFTTHLALAESGGAKIGLVKPLRADAIGRIGFGKLLAGDTVDPTTLDANYIRRSDAELYTQPKR